MRKISFVVLLCAICAMFNIACEGGVSGTKGTLTVTSTTSLILDSEGGLQEISFNLGGASDYQNVKAECDAEWITDLTVDESVKFMVEKNELEATRVAVILISYGEQSVSVNVAQKAYESPYDVDFAAQKFNATYYGKVGSSAFNYTLILSDKGVPTASNQYFGSKQYYFDIYTDVTQGFTTEPVPIPAGEYKLDNANRGEVGSMNSKYSYYVEVSEAGDVLTSYIISGSVIVTESGVEALIYLDCGEWHHVTFEGEMMTGFDYLKDPAYQPPYSLFTEDYTFDVDGGFIGCYYRGDHFGLGYDVWYISAIEEKQGFNGRYFAIEILVEPGKGYRQDAYLGEYKACKVSTGEANTFIPGHLRNGYEPLNSWAMWCENAMTLGDWGGPVADGTIKFEHESGNYYTLTFDCKCDAGHAIKGVFKGVVGEHINQCPELEGDNLLPAL